MAVVRETQKDVGRYEPKLISFFTTRQVICLCVGAVPALLVGYVLKTSGMVSDPYVLVGFFTLMMTVPGFLAFGQELCHGQKPEDFMRDYYYYRILSPAKRLHRVESADDALYHRQGADGKGKHRKDREYPDYL